MKTGQIDMKISRRGLDLIKKFEGFSAKAYIDPVGIPTIGYGLTFYPIVPGVNSIRKDVKMGDVITKAKAETFLQVIADEYGERMLNKVRVQLNQNQYDALVSFVYNIGLGAFEDSTLLKLLNKGKFADASLQFARWNKGEVNGQIVILPGLVTRREEERKLFVA